VSAVAVSDYNIRYLWTGKYTPDCGIAGVLCVHATLMGLMVFVHINTSSMIQSITVARSISFTMLSILWSYVVGVSNTVNALQSKEDCKVSRAPLRVVGFGP
jgi:hypothetical protein